jgi:LmbE family N-acetylglucosaminyl deacetylase
LDANPAPAVILSPHLDDAVFSCWHLLDSPRAVSVVNVFAGVPAPGTALPRWDRITGANNPVTRMQQRIEEDRAALARAGREPTNLSFVDGQYRDERPSLADVLPSVRDNVPWASGVFAPAGIGGHSAHCVLRDAGLALAREGRAVSFYADIPYATEFGWPAWVAGVEPEAFLDVDAAWAEALEPIIAGGWRPTVVTLAESAQQRKLEALRAYRTQFSALEAGGQRRLTHPELVRYEVAWIRPAP